MNGDESVGPSFSAEHGENLEVDPVFPNQEQIPETEGVSGAADHSIDTTSHEEERANKEQFPEHEGVGHAADHSMETPSHEEERAEEVSEMCGD